LKPIKLAALLAPLTLLAGGLAGGLPTVDEAGFQQLVHSHKGKVVVYDFWATYCEPCREELPQLVKLEAKLRARGFELVTISADEPERDADASKVIRKLGVTGAAYRKQAQDDDHFINAIDPKWSGAMPALFLYDRNGRKVRSFIGESDLAAVEKAIEKLL
jgi:thiol-disulfide isomerase/thioredoxin